MNYIDGIPAPYPRYAPPPELFKGTKPTARLNRLPNLSATCTQCGRWELAVREEFQRFGNPECQNCGNPHVNWAAAWIPDELREKARAIVNAVTENSPQ